MTPKKRDWRAGLGYYDGRMDDMVHEYAYDPSAPFDEAQLLQAISSILSVPNLQVLLDNRNFITYIEGMFRIGPYSDEAVKASVEVMLETWNERLAAYATHQSEVDENNRIRKANQSTTHLQTSEPEAASSDSSTSPPEDSAASQATPTRDNAMTFSSCATPQTPNDAKPGDEPALPTVDENKFAYSAWLMHEGLQQRLLAAAQYIDHFQVLNLTLSDDPALDNIARIDAFRVLSKGGRSNIHAAKRFLDSLRRQMELEGKKWPGQGLSTQQTPQSNPTEASFSDSPKKSPQHDDFDLSDGESEIEDDDTLANE